MTYPRLSSICRSIVEFPSAQTDVIINLTISCGNIIVFNSSKKCSASNQSFIFIVPNLSKTLIELDNLEKNALNELKSNQFAYLHQLSLQSNTDESPTWLSEVFLREESITIIPALNMSDILKTKHMLIKEVVSIPSRHRSIHSSDPNIRLHEYNISQRFVIMAFLSIVFVLNIIWDHFAALANIFRQNFDSSAFK